MFLIGKASVQTLPQLSNQFHRCAFCRVMTSMSSTMINDSDEVTAALKSAQFALRLSNQFLSRWEDAHRRQAEKVQSELRKFASASRLFPQPDGPWTRTP
jgi:hypothetical protein